MKLRYIIGSMRERGTINAIFILRRLQEEYHAKRKKLYMCFVDPEKAFDRLPRTVLEWAMRKKGIPEALVRSVMSLYEGAKSERILSCQRHLKLKWGYTNDLCCHLLFLK